MRLENIVTPVDKMSHEELMSKIDAIREGRLLPAPRSETKKAKSSRRVEDSLKTMFDKMTPEEKQQFMKDLEG